MNVCMYTSGGALLSPNRRSAASDASQHSPAHVDMHMHMHMHMNMHMHMRMHMHTYRRCTA